MPNDFEQVAADAARNAASAEQVVRNLITKSKQNETFTDAVMGFVSAVDWSEHWLWALGAWHVLMLLLVLATRHEWNLQAGLLALMLALCYFAETLNSLAREHWQLFASQNYFDPHGVFISIVFSGPLILIALVILVNGLYQSGSLLIKVKRLEIKAKSKEKKSGKSN